MEDGMSDEYGPPTLEDDLWFHEHVRAAEYPKVKRGDKPMEGQVQLFIDPRLNDGTVGYTAPKLTEAEMREMVMIDDWDRADEHNRPDVRPHSWMSEGVYTDIRCRDCGVTTDAAFKTRYDEEGCEFDVNLALDLAWADEQRAREDEAQQFRDHRPE